MDKEQRASWGPAVRDARRRAGMSQDALAEAANTTRRTIGSLERGDTAPQPGTLDRIRQVLGLDGDDLFDEEVNTYLSIIGSLFQEIPPAQRGEALRRVILSLTQSIAVAGTTGSDDAGAFGIDTTSERPDDD